MAGLVAAGQDGAARFGVLGPLQVVDARGTTWPVLAAKQRIVLAALLLGGGATVSAASLSEALWDESPPPNAAAVLRTYVARLRRALGPLSVRVVSRPPGWSLLLHEAAELDLTEVERLRAAARSAGEAGDWKRASSLLGAALSQWRGEPLIDVPSAALARRDADRLSELRVQLTLARIDADLQLNRDAELVPELRRLAAEHPLREHIRVQLMIACYRCGHQAAALDVYRDAHRTLATELGVEPGPELREMHRRILAGDRDLSGPRLAAAAGAAPLPLTVPRQLPAGPRHFAGRAEELTALHALLDGDAEAGAVVIGALSGAAGVGKTALALHWAHRVADRFPDGQLYADLRGRDPAADPVGPADLIARFLIALGVTVDQMPAGADARQDLYRSLLARRRMLIVLDNACDAAQVRPLLPGGSSCVVLVTSRGPLTSLIATQAACPLSLDVLSTAEAHELLVLRLGAERVAAEPGPARTLTVLCARLPVALAIVASRAVLHPDMPLAVLAGELRAAGGPADAIDAGDGVSITAVFSWSYQHLPNGARRMFRLLGLHPGPDISVAAAASLAAVSAGEARACLAQLTETGMLSEHAPGRFRFHDLLRGYAAGRAQDEDGEPSRHAAIHRSLDHYLHSAHAASKKLGACYCTIEPAALAPGAVPELAGDFRQAMAWFTAEHDVLSAQVGLAGGAGFDAHGWQLSETLSAFFDRRGHTEGFLAVLRAALTAALNSGDRRAQSEANSRIACTLVHLGDTDEADYHCRQALELSRVLGDKPGEAHALFGLAIIAEREDRSAEALALALHILELIRPDQDRTFYGVVLNVVGWCGARLGDYQQALGYCRRAVSVHQEVGDAYREAQDWDSVGYIYSHLRRYPEAVECYERALSLLRQVGARGTLALVLAGLGDAHEAGGQARLAAQARDRAQAVRDEIGAYADSSSGS